MIPSSPSPVLPMSAAVDGIRRLMYGGSGMTALTDAGVLAIWLLGALAITTIAAVRMTHRRTLRDLRPSLIGHERKFTRPDELPDGGR